MLSFTSTLSICNPSNLIDVILISSKTTGSTRMLKVNEKRKMRLTDYVLLRSSQSNLYSVSQDFHVMKHRSDYVSASSYFLFFVVFPNLVAIVFDRMRSLLLGSQFFVIKVVSVYFRQHVVNTVGCDFYFFVLSTLYVGYHFLQYGPSILPKYPTS